MSFTMGVTVGGSLRLVLPSIHSHSGCFPGKGSHCDARVKPDPKLSAAAVASAVVPGIANEKK